MLVPGCAFHRTIGDVYIDDIVIIALVHFSRPERKNIPAQHADVRVIGYGGVCKEMWDDVRTRGVGRENEESWVSA